MVNYLALLMALVLSGVAAYYSVIGLAAIFAASFWPIVIMGGSLEAAKLVATSWIYRNWEGSPKVIKYYLVVAIVILMLITSMGTFGYLSKAHMDQGVPTGAVQDKVTILDEKIRTEKENIDAARKALKQMDESVDQVLARSTDEKGANNAASMRRSQQKERSILVQDIAQAQSRIVTLQTERAPIASELRKVVAEVGPIKYIAELIYGESNDDILDKAVRWVIILIVAVFDPLAVALLLAANHGLSNAPVKPPKTIFVEKEPAKDPPKKKEKLPLWARKAGQLIEKKKKGTIEIDKNSVVRMK